MKKLMEIAHVTFQFSAAFMFVMIGIAGIVWIIIATAGLLLE